MKILLLPLYPEHHPSSRNRVYHYLPFLDRAGIESEVIPAVSLRCYQAFYHSDKRWHRWRYHASEIQSRLKARLRAGRFDLIWVQKAYSLIYWRWWNALFKGVGKRLIYDLDDAVFLSPPARPPQLMQFLEDSNQIDRLIQQAQRVFAGSRMLVEAVRSKGGNPLFLPTPVDTVRFHPVERKPSNRIVIGWTGSSATHSCLNSLHAIWQPLAQRHPGLEFVFISNQRKGVDREAFSTLPVRYFKWTPEREAEFVQEMDIGIMPLEQDEFQRYKCGFKALQYMACGLPVVCTPIGAAQDIVDHNKTGFWASTNEEWIEALSQLIQSSQLRREMGQSGRRKVEAEYSLSTCAERLINTLQSMTS